MFSGTLLIKIFNTSGLKIVIPNDKDEDYNSTSFKNGIYTNAYKCKKTLYAYADIIECKAFVLIKCQQLFVINFIKKYNITYVNFTLCGKINIELFFKRNLCCK